MFQWKELRTFFVWGSLTSFTFEGVLIEGNSVRL